MGHTYLYLLSLCQVMQRGIRNTDDIRNSLETDRDMEYKVNLSKTSRTITKIGIGSMALCLFAMWYFLDPTRNFIGGWAGAIFFHHFNHLRNILRHINVAAPHYGLR